MEERRKFNRLPVDTEVKINSLGAGDTHANTVNIGGGGILLSSESPYEPGSVLEIEVLTGVHKSFQHAFKPLKARIKIIRVSENGPPFEIAAEFVAIEQE